MADHGHGGGHGGGDHGHAPKKESDHGGGHKGGGGGGGGTLRIVWFALKACLVLLPVFLVARGIQAIWHWSPTKAVLDLADKGVEWTSNHDHVITDTLNRTSVQKPPTPTHTASAPRKAGKPGPALVRR